MKSAQIGASGVLLIQYRLLKLGFDSAQMTTDDGIDLMVYEPTARLAHTVQVKTCLKPKPAGGKGAPTLDWWLRKNSPAQLVGLVDLSSDETWLFRHAEFESAAQQQPDDRLHFYFYTEDDFAARPGCHRRDFKQFRLPDRALEIFGPPEISN